MSVNSNEYCRSESQGWYLGHGHERPAQVPFASPSSYRRRCVHRRSCAPSGTAPRFIADLHYICFAQDGATHTNRTERKSLSSSSKYAFGHFVKGLRGRRKVEEKTDGLQEGLIRLCSRLKDTFTCCRGWEAMPGRRRRYLSGLSRRSMSMPMTDFLGHLASAPCPTKSHSPAAHSLPSPRRGYSPVPNSSGSRICISCNTTIYRLAI